MGAGTRTNTQRSLFAQPVIFHREFCICSGGFFICFVVSNEDAMVWTHTWRLQNSDLCTNERAEKHDWIGNYRGQIGSVCDRKERPPDHRLCRNNPATDRTRGLPKPKSCVSK